MLLDPLVSVIDTLQKRIAAHRQSLQQNETRTRTALIDPLLAALGWDVADPGLVTPEYNVGQGRADYALKGPQTVPDAIVEVPDAIVEVKRLGHILNDREQMQMLTYANMEGIKYALLTDGNIWELYDIFKPAHLAERRILSVKIANSPAYKLALELLLLWRPNLASGNPVTAREPVLGPKPTPPPDETDWVKLSTYSPPVKTGSPKKIRFPDKTEKPVKNWSNLLVVIGEWLNATGKLTSIATPVFSGPKEIVLDTDYSKFRSHSSISTTSGVKLYVNTHGSAKNMRHKAKSLLRKCGVSLDQVLLLPAKEIRAPRKIENGQGRA